MTLTFRQKIAFGFLLVIALAVGVGGYQLASLDKVAETGDRVVSRDIPTLRAIYEVEISRSTMRELRKHAELTYFKQRFNASDETFDAAQTAWRIQRDATKSQIDRLIVALTGQLASADDDRRRELWRNLLSTTEKQRATLNVDDTVDALFAAYKADDFAKARALEPKLVAERKTFNELSDVAEQLAVDLSTSAATRIRDNYESVRAVSLAVLVGVFACAALVAFLLYRSLTRPLAEFVSFAEKVGNGDLSQKLRTGNDEIGRLGATLNAMVDGLRVLTDRIRGGAESIASAVAEMQASAQQQATSTTEQSSAIQEFASTLEQIGESGAQVSERAKAVSSEAEATSTVAVSGVDAVRDTNRSMDSIRDQAETVASIIVRLTEKTRDVGNIVATVDEIAEHSNLLALNAAIEASSAGEFGSRFSVVAEEMRNLAERAREATRQIRGLLGDMQQAMSSAVMQTEEAVKRVQLGKQHSDSAERTIHELTKTVEQSVTAFRQIVAGIGQQQIGINQASLSVQGVREAMDQVVTGTRNLDEAARSLEDLTVGLRQSVERYRL
jgi:methyl-accepting chemotaxis protein